MRDQHRVEERAGKAGKCQTMSGTAQAGQDCAAWIANEINNEFEVLTTALFIAGAVYVLFPFVEHVGPLMALSFTLGLALGSAQPMVMSLLHSIAPAGRMGEAVGLRMSIINASTFAVPLLFGAIGSSIGIGPVFWLVGGGASPAADPATSISFLNSLRNADGGYAPAASPPGTPLRSSLRATISALRAIKYFSGQPSDEVGTAKFVERCYDWRPNAGRVEALYARLLSRTPVTEGR